MTTDELRAKFEARFPRLDLSKDEYGNYYNAKTLMHFYGWQAAHASRDAEIEALQDALFQISVRLKAEREPDMDDMSWHTDMIARAQYLANLEDAAMREES